MYQRYLYVHSLSSLLLCPRDSRCRAIKFQLLCPLFKNTYTYSQHCPLRPRLQPPNANSNKSSLLPHSLYIILLLLPSLDANIDRHWYCCNKSTKRDLECHLLYEFINFTNSFPYLLNMISVHSSNWIHYLFINIQIYCSINNIVYYTYNTTALLELSCVDNKEDVGEAARGTFCCKRLIATDSYTYIPHALCYHNKIFIIPNPRWQ